MHIQHLHLYVLTGASRGLGQAMARELLVPGHALLCIARHADPELASAAAAAGARLEQWCHDLAAPEAAGHRLRAWLSTHSSHPWHSVTLINNAAAMPPIGPLRDTAPADLALCLRVGLEAPLQLSAAFLQATRGWTARRRILNISSGLGRRAMASQTPYCAVKAGLDHATRCMAQEEARETNGARVCSLAPGVIDTDMQVQLRQADARAFPDQPGFANLHANGMLSSPQDAARRVLAYLARPDFGDQPVADVRDAA